MCENLTEHESLILIHLTRNQQTLLSLYQSKEIQLFSGYKYITGLVPIRKIMFIDRFKD